MDRGVADGAGGVLVFGAFAEVATHKHTAIPDRAFGDVGLGVEDEHIRRIAKAGIFPTKERISWEGHLSGMIVGVFLAFYYRNLGPQRPKYQYEIEKELGIEPPDLEGMYLEKLRIQEEEARLREEALRNVSSEIHVHYIYTKNPPDPNKNPD